MLVLCIVTDGKTMKLMKIYLRVYIVFFAHITGAIHPTHEKTPNFLDHIHTNSFQIFIKNNNDHICTYIYVLYNEKECLIEKWGVNNWCSNSNTKGIRRKINLSILKCSWNERSLKKQNTFHKDGNTPEMSIEKKDEIPWFGKW